MFTVSGANSLWTTESSFYVGREGVGSLAVTGGEVIAKGTTWVGYAFGASGVVHFHNGTLTTNGLMCELEDLSGSGVINTHGLVSDIDLVLDATHGLVQSFTIGGSGRDITVNLFADGPFDPEAGNADRSIRLGAGYRGVGSISISDGIALTSTYGYLGYHSGSSGTATINGDGSIWDNGESLLVGYGGSGSLAITGAGQASCWSGKIGYQFGSTGHVIVDGDGSTWSNKWRLTVGNEGDGSLVVTGGGKVASQDGDIGDRFGSTGDVVVNGHGSMWDIEQALVVGDLGSGSLAITNGGKVSTESGRLGRWAGSMGVVEVDGDGSTWSNSDRLTIGYSGAGSLTITNGGLVSVGDIFTIDYDANDDSFVNMSTGGILALYGDADDSLADYLDLTRGTDAIRYWDDSISRWANITGATPGEDYTLAYIDDANSDLYGYTVLTVGTVPVPEPSGLVLLAGLGMMLLGRKSPISRSRLANGT